MAILVLSTLISFVCFRVGSAGVLPLSDAETQAAVDAHNKYRIDAGAVAMQKLKWNNALAQFAQKTASQCNFEHSSYQARQNVAGFSYIGENIYTISGAVDKPTLQKAVDDWASEQKDYDLNSNWCGSMCGHYTQIVWASTTDVGCAIAQCDSVQGFTGDRGYIIFCNYGIGGNMVGEKPYERASSSWEIGSKCQEMYNEAADSSGLCVSTSDGSGPPAGNTINDVPDVETTTAANPGSEDCTRKWDCNYICQEGDLNLAALNGYANCNWECDFKCV